MQGMYEVNSTTVTNTVKPTGVSTTLRNNGFDNHLFYVNISATSGSPSLTVAVQRQDPISGVWDTVLTSAALTSIGLTVLQVGKDFQPVANVSANAMLGANYRLSWTVADTVQFSIAIYSK